MNPVLVLESYQTPSFFVISFCPFNSSSFLGLYFADNVGHHHHHHSHHDHHQQDHQQQDMFRECERARGGEDGGDIKRRRGRPVGSKDRQPRVKRLDEKEARDAPGGRRKPWKIILTAEQAVQIYEKRPTEGSMTDTTTSSCRSNEVAEQYGVNSKTIRDIWNRATWVKATRGCWTVEEEEEYNQNQIARAQDSKSGSTDGASKGSSSGHGASNQGSPPDGHNHHREGGMVHPGDMLNGGRVPETVGGSLDDEYWLHGSGSSVPSQGMGGGGGGSSGPGDASFKGAGNKRTRPTGPLDARRVRGPKPRGMRSDHCDDGEEGEGGSSASSEGGSGRSGESGGSGSGGSGSRNDDYSPQSPHNSRMDRREAKLDTATVQQLVSAQAQGGLDMGASPGRMMMMMMEAHGRRALADGTMRGLVLP
mmetsp:Transcript_12480/g.24858  ORF Transcript_12480/g.24858 Transcript_12480/m.24858 type:complete len:421 (+) Transcript_12480:848-2110(+)